MRFPMHIALVSEHASPLASLGSVDAGGQNVHVRDLAVHLARIGHRVSVHTRRDDPELPAAVELCSGVTVMHEEAGPATHIPKDELLPLMPAFADALHRCWMDDPPDVVHAHFWMSGFASVLAARRTIPVLQTFHALGSVKRRHQGTADTSPPERLSIERGLLHQTSGVLATCRDEVHELLQLGADPSRLRVIPCGVDLDRFAAPAGPPPSRPPGSPRRVLSLGRLVPRKGVDDTIRAIARLGDTELLVAGGPSPSAVDTDPEVARLRRVAREAGAERRVTFLGAVAPQDVPALIRSADVVAAVPWYEPFGIVPLEAMACGVPVVGSSVGGLLDTIVHERTGLLVPPRAPDALAAALDRLLGRPDERRAMGQAGAERVRRRFAWPAVAGATALAYAEVVAHHRQAVPA